MTMRRARQLVGRHPMSAGAVFWWFAVSAIPCGDDAVDPSRPIVLIHDDGFAARHRELTAIAAENWDLEVGTEISTGDEPSAAQDVQISWWEGECRFEEGSGSFVGRVLDIRAPQLYLCPQATGDDLPLYFEVIRHELGHVLGLEHVDGDGAVMAAAGPDSPQRRRFLPQDRAEFSRVNPDFVCPGECAINHAFAED